MSATRVRKIVSEELFLMLEQLPLSRRQSRFHSRTKRVENCAEFARGRCSQPLQLCIEGVEFPLQRITLGDRQIKSAFNEPQEPLMLAEITHLADTVTNDDSHDGGTDECADHKEP